MTIPITPRAPLAIAVIGAGHIGGTLGRAWLRAGHSVRFGLRDGSSREDLPDGAVRKDIAAAIAEAEVVLFAVPGAAMEALVAEVGASLAGRIVIDATNHMGVPVLHSTELDEMRASGVAVYRAFNTLGWEVLADPGFGTLAADLFYAGPEGPGRPVVEALIEAVGLAPVWLGDGQAETVDGAGRLWFALVMGRGLPRTSALKVLTR